ncbi:hypothetical protein [Leptospira sp. 'Mane']|uniref:hypothetical protein n=1 Tax=Leptospira sp. 'Mane' TaxID=3387407 RepID=UPI00398BB2B7
MPPGTNGSGTNIDLSLGQGINSGTYPVALIDSSSNKLLVITTNGANNNKLSLFRCNLDGTSCTHTDISAGQGTGSGGDLPSGVIDYISNKLIVVTNNGANNNKPSLFRCNLDGSNCTHTDISIGQGTGSGNAPSVVIDSISSKVLVLTKNVANNSKPSLFRCDLDGTNCTHTDISTGQGSDCGWSPFAIIDSISNKLLVVTTNGANSFKPSLFRCNLDGSNCTHTDISASENANSGMTPAAVIDPILNKLLVVTYNYARNGKSSLFRCDLNGSNCTHSDISTGQGTDSGYTPSVLLDLISSKILVVTFNVANSSKPSLFRCNSDGSNCTHTDISAGQGYSSGQQPFALFDPITGKLLVVTTNNSLPSLFLW